MVSYRIVILGIRGISNIRRNGPLATAKIPASGLFTVKRPKCIRACRPCACAFRLHYTLLFQFYVYPQSDIEKNTANKIGSQDITGPMIA